MPSFPNSSFGGFNRRKAEKEKRDKEAAERKAKQDLEPKMSTNELKSFIGTLMQFAVDNQEKREEKIREKRLKNGGW